mgnify:FL=1
MSKRRVSVIRGGPSEEYEVSLRTGSGVLDALRETDYVTQDIVVMRNGDWLVGGRVRSPEQALSTTDVVFNALHGAYGEDGQLQRYLDRLGIRYTGSGAYASAIAMNKVLTKEHLRDANILMAQHMRLTRDGVDDVARTAHMVGELFGPIYVVKPLSGGSSVGTAIAHGTAELAKVLESSFTLYDEVMVERYVTGREATVGVIEGYRGEELYNLPVIEIVPPKDSGFFAADVKYNGATEEICPGRFSQAEKREIERIGRAAHELLGLRHYSRTDVIVAEDGIYFLEVNTLPGLTPTSLIPAAIDAVGGTYKGLVLHLIDRALT